MSPGHTPSFLYLTESSHGGREGRGRIFQVEHKWPGTCSSVVCVGCGVDPGLGHGGLLHTKGQMLCTLLLLLLWVKGCNFKLLCILSALGDLESCTGLFHGWHLSIFYLGFIVWPQRMENIPNDFYNTIYRRYLIHIQLMQQE